MQLKQPLHHVLILLAATVFTLPVWGQDWDAVEIKSYKAGANVYMLEGSGGNIGVLINDDHVVVIDSQFEPLYDKIRAAIGELTDKPVRYLVLTHWHYDHVSGNQRFHQEGVAIISHENVKKRMIEGGVIEFFSREVPPQPRKALPDLTFSDQVTIDMGREKLILHYAENAHTDGDAIVYLPANNVLHMGDVYMSNMYPFFDLSSGGTINGLIAACDRALALCNDNTVVIPGHGALSNSAELKRYTAMLKSVAHNVESRKAEGAELSEILEAATEFMQPHEAEFNKGFIDARTIVTFVYNTL